MEINMSQGDNPVPWRSTVYISGTGLSPCDMFISMGQDYFLVTCLSTWNRIISLGHVYLQINLSHGDKHITRR
jgi:hypothetical protein